MFLSKDMQMIQKLATGGMAEVWEARLRGTGGFDKQLAIKRLLPHLEENEDVVRLFLHEGRLAAMLNHPNICQIFQLGQHNGRHYIAMEYIDGFNLDTLLRTAAERGVYLPLVYVCHIISEVCRGLDYAHGLTDEEGRPLQLVHRDLSPSNIMLTWSGHIKIVDFGIAKAANQLHETPTGVIRGKFGYISPEYVLDEPLDWRSDIFTLGIVVWEMLAGRRMFVGDSEWARMAKISRGHYPRPSDFRADLPEGVEDIAMRALQRNPHARYQTCGDMLNAVRQLMRRYQAETDPQQLSAYLKALFSDAPLPTPKYDLTPHKDTPSDSSPSVDEPEGVQETKQIIAESGNRQLQLLADRQLAWLSKNSDEVEDEMLFFAEQGAHIQLLPHDKNGLAISLTHKFDACLFSSINANSLALLHTIQQLRPSLPCLLWGASHKAEPYWQAKGGFGIIPKDSKPIEWLERLQDAFDYVPTGEALKQFIEGQLFTPLAHIFAQTSLESEDVIAEHHYQLSLQYAALCQWLAALVFAANQQGPTRHPRTQALLKELWQHPGQPYEYLTLAAKIIARKRLEGHSSLWQELERCIQPLPAQHQIHAAITKALEDLLAPLGYVPSSSQNHKIVELPMSPLFGPLEWYYQRYWRAGLPPGSPSARLVATIEQAMQSLVAQLYHLIDYSIANVDQARQTAKTTNHSLTRYRGLDPSPAPLLSPSQLAPGRCYLFATYRSEPIVPLHPLLNIDVCPTCNEPRFATIVRWVRHENPLSRGLRCRHLQLTTQTKQ